MYDGWTLKKNVRPVRIRGIEQIFQREPVSYCIAMFLVESIWTVLKDFLSLLKKSPA